VKRPSIPFRRDWRSTQTGCEPSQRVPLSDVGHHRSTAHCLKEVLSSNRDISVLQPGGQGLVIQAAAYACLIPLAAFGGCSTTFWVVSSK
jgi:hypothetical protein